MKGKDLNKINARNIIVLLSVLTLFHCRNTREVVYEGARASKPLVIDTLFDLYLSKYRDYIDENNDTTLFPRCYEEGKLQLVTSDDWTSGFFPGILWYLYEYSGDERILKNAKSWTNSLYKQRFNTSTHDIGFIINSSFGQGYRITKNEFYKEVLNIAANSLASRYDDNIGCIKSLDSFDAYEFPVLIDNMVNLEILYKARRWNDEDRFYNIAHEHALKTMEMHFKSDFSSFQVVDYDKDTYHPVFKGTFQGYADSSSWSRGQAWGLYGFILAFRETKDRVYLDQSVRIADYILENENFPVDCIPYWDFEAPDIPNTYRDAAAAAIMASAFIDLSSFSEVDQPEQYLAVAENIIRSLASGGYIAERNEYENFILKHGVGNKPGGTEIDIPLIYGDYYFLEALMKYKKIINNAANED